MQRYFISRLLLSVLLLFGVLLLVSGDAYHDEDQQQNAEKQ